MVYFGSRPRSDWRGGWTLLLLILWIACLAAPARAASAAEARGDRAFGNRAQGFLENGVPDPQPIADAIAAYEEALEQDPDNIRLHCKLMDSLYYQGYFIATEKDEKREIFERIVVLSERALALVVDKSGRRDAPGLPLEERAEALRPVPEAAEVHYWVAAAWGLWGTTHSPLSAVRKGVIAKVRDNSRMTALLDESFEGGGGLRLLGRLTTRAPKVPFFTGWIDRQEGIEMLRRALAISRRNPRNLLFLAEAILEYEQENRAEALDLLRELAGRQPDPAELAEESESIEQARLLLAELED